MKNYSVLLFLFVAVFAESWVPIQDIPIEYYEPQEYQESHIDHEILLRPSRQSINQDDSKESYFRYLRSFNDDPDLSLEITPNEPNNVPRPGGFRRIIIAPKRSKRAISDTKKDKPNKEIDPVIAKQWGKPLELVTLDPSNDTAADSLNDTTALPAEDVLTNTLLINDFIRFRREAHKSMENVLPVVDSTTDLTADDAGRSVGMVDRSKRDDKKSEAPNHMMSATNSVTDTFREPRGSTKEQWVKHAYPVLNEYSPYENEQLGASSSLVRAPRVHFVTQRRPEVFPPPSNPYNREGRLLESSRDANREPFREPARNFYRDPSQGEDYYSQRYTRHFNPLPPLPPNSRYESRYYDDKDRYDPRSEYYPGRDRIYSAATNRQRRVIYYANLPEVTRSPPSVDLRDRYRFRYNYDDRYENSADPYRLRNTYTKSRFDDIERPKSPYPQKVSTDVNVREIKKNPERRIYSEVDRRFDYKAPPS